MLRALILAIVLTILACDRREGPTTPAVPESSSAATVTALASEADGGNGAPQSDHVLARVVMHRYHSKVRECEGQDGHYFEDHGAFYGTSVGDSRLTGDVEFDLILDLFNATAGGGPQYARIVIRDPVTGRKKAEGTSSAWGITFVKGTIVGDVRDDGAGAEDQSGAGKLVAGFEFRNFEDGSFGIQIGGPATDNLMPAGIWSGRCNGRFTEADFDFGASSAKVGTASTSLGRWRGLSF